MAPRVSDTRTSARAMLAAWALLWPSVSSAVFDLPSDPNGCPASCRRTDWSAGLDPEGGIPTYPVAVSVVDYGASGGDAVADDAGFAAALAACPAGSAVLVPAGTYLLATDLKMKTRVALRGAGPGQTILQFTGGGNGAWFDGGQKADMGPDITITDLFAAGSRTLVLASVSGLAKDDWVSIFEDNDTAIPVDVSKCGWCGDDTGSGRRALQQFARIDAIDGTARTITLNRPLYYTLKASLNPGVKMVPFGVAMAGLEDLTIEGVRTTGSLIHARFTRHVWLKNIETYNAGGQSGDAHVRIEFSHGWELRDSWVHHGHGYNSGSNYGFFPIFWNSDHKVENNVFFACRHAIVMEGGGAGCAVLYNFVDGAREGEEPPYLNADINPNHGPHPHMNLYEGNVSAKFTSDWTMGSSSHQVFLRNWVRAWRSEPAITWGRWAVDSQSYNRFGSYVGNVLLRPEDVQGTVWSGTDCSPSEPAAWHFGCDGQPGSYVDDQAAATAIRHGNYDFITGGVDNWESVDHEIPASFYYASRPAFWDSRGCGRPWPSIGPDVAGIAVDIPAKDRAEGETWPGACDGGTPDGGAPDAGLDAGPADAGTADAGIADAGAPDAGPGDAGNPDAGTTDAGTPDAGLADAGNPDAGTTDAGVLDAGGSDAGNADAGGAPADAAPPGSDSLSATGSGCGCQAGGASHPAFALGLAALTLCGIGRRRARG